MARKGKTLVPGARNALDRMKYEVADEQGVELKEGYNGDLRSRDAGKIGGNMVRKMIRQAEQNMSENERR
ncbi:MAG: alpha/beta-type small acid-soluble spore protein [Burkholderiales bacterium]